MNGKRSGAELTTTVGPPYVVTKKLRSQRQCRIRAQISPILKMRGSVVDSSCGSQFNVVVDEVSCDSSVVTVESNEVENAAFKRITRSIQKQIESNNQSKESSSSTTSEVVVEVSESSCVESNSNASALFGNDKRTSSEIEVSCNDDVVSFTTTTTTTTSTSGVVDSCSVATKPYKQLKLTDLSCTEKISSSSNDYEDISSELQYSDYDFTDYSSPSSVFFDSSCSDFSEKSVGDHPSHTFATLLQLRQQFVRSTNCNAIAASSLIEEDQVAVRFENEEDEESYRMLRSRERNQEYRSTTTYGDLVIQQRSYMVDWIVEQCKGKKYQEETIFIAVGLIDRFLTKGCFKNIRSLQILGAACLALATRIEENQPYNTVDQRYFHIGSNIYARCEVVAMEWLVQEVLSFRCFFPTIYNFLWFYLKAARADAVMEKKVKYLAVLVLSNQEYLCHRPSTIAASLVILASKEENQERIIKIHTRTKDNDLPDSIKSLKWVLQYVN